MRITLNPRVLAAVACVGLAVLAPITASATTARDVTIEMKGTLTGPDSVAGTWSASGAFADSGTYSEAFRFLGDRVSGVKTLTGARGTIVFKVKATMIPTSPSTIRFEGGRWEFVSGTGAYARIKGGGNPATDPGTADLATGAVAVVHRGHARL